ncbi:MAG: GNAT family N-acetyltransferase [Acidimicrobiales bacterium]
MDDVRRATSADRPAVTSWVAAAFAQDPAWLYLLGHDYDRLAPAFAGALFDLRVGSDDVWIAGDGATALWEPPARPRMMPAQADEVWNAFRALAGEAVARRLAEYGRAVDAVRTTEPHWYLGVLATRPDRQRHGLASAVIAPVVAAADAAGVPCCLETSTVGNKSFYARRGFTEATDVSIEGGPPTWWLLRPPGPIQD